MTSWASPCMSLLLSPKSVLYLISVLFGVLFLPLFAAISWPIYGIAKVFSKFEPSYGKFISYMDAWLEEEYVTRIPRNSIVTTLVINGDLPLDELKSLFVKNVLEARSKWNPKRHRYPELKQYLTTFMGFRIWRNDDTFRIDNHIVERFQNIGNQCCEKSYKDLSSIHQSLLDIPYQRRRSPWEIILFRNIKLNDQHVTTPKTLVACRMHHVMADGKSLIKLFVECLGAQELTSVPSQNDNESWLDKLKFYTFYFLHVFRHYIYIAIIVPKSHFHPFKVYRFWKGRDVKMVLAFTPKLLMSDAKNVAKTNGVTGSSVFMSIIAGAIRKCGDELTKGDVAIGYTLPKPDHPEILTNHYYMGFLELPTKQENVIQRLKECNDSFEEIRATQRARYLNFTAILGGSLLYPLTRLVVNQFAPTGITNIAGEQVGFSVGTGEVVDFRMSTGTLEGVAGVVFCVFSYKDEIRIAVTAKETVLNKREVHKLALDIKEELKLLIKISNLKEYSFLCENDV